MATPTLRQAFEEGQYARINGRKAKDNPYGDEVANFYWREGWLHPYGEISEVAPYMGLS